MLIDNYYTILQRTDTADGVVFHVRLNPDCKVYEGHFPQEPVSPGVCNIEMIKELAEQVAGRKLMLNYIQQCRLTTLITPLQYPELDINISLLEMQNANVDSEKTPSASIDSAENHSPTFKLVASIEAASTLCLTLKAEVK